jgi:hypothetical protein
MPDMDFIRSISTALTLASRLKAVNDRIKDAEFQGLLADLQVELAEAKA